MKIANVTLESMSPISFSRPHDTAKKEKEGPDEYERRTWREKLHVVDGDEVCIPPTMLKNCIGEGARYLSIKIPGQRNATYTKHFQAGIMITDAILLGVKKSAVRMDRIYCNADGKPGVGSRVWRHFPTIDKWSGLAVVYILDDKIPKDIFAKVLSECGNFIGMGRFRPINRGYYGRFKVVSIKWDEQN